MKTALILFEQSGTFQKMYQDLGYNSIAVDIQNGIDILEFDYKQFDNVDVIIAHPPCTEFSVSGACWWPTKPAHKLEMAIRLVKKTIEIINYHNPRVWFIENPVGRIESCVPRMKQFFKWWFHPCWFAKYSDSPQFEAYTKKTILWGEYAIPVKNGINPVRCPKTGHSLDYLYRQIHGKEPPKKQRNKIRSKTPQGFARAFVQANINYKPSIQLNLFNNQ